MIIDSRQDKAIAAVLEAKYQDIKRHEAYRMHQKACRWVSKYGLPYRVALDYLKKYDLTSPVVLINPCYPLPGYRKKDLITITWNDLDLLNPENFEVLPDGKIMYVSDIFDRPLPEVAERIEQHNQSFRPWDLKTAAGRTRWEKEFAHFLDGYDLDSFDSWDMFGNMDASKDALYAAKEHYKGILFKYRDSKTGYRTEEPPYLPEYHGIYTTREFLLHHEDEEL